MIKLCQGGGGGEGVCVEGAVIGGTNTLPFKLHPVWSAGGNITIMNEVNSWKLVET